MRLAIDVRSLMDGRLSGVEVYTINIIRSMVRLFPQHSYHLFYNARSPVKLPLFSDVTVHRFPWPNTIFNAVQWLAHFPKWDSLVQADCFFVPSLRLIPLRTSTPLVTTVHDISYEHFPYFFSSKRRVWHGMMRTKTLLQRSNQLIAVSAATARDIEDVYGIDSHKIQVIHSGVSTIPVSPEQQKKVRKKYNLPEKYVLFIGTVEPRKNVISIIHAFSTLAPYIPHHVVIAGSPGWLTGTVDMALKDSVYRDRVHMAGFIAEEDLSALYAGADVFIYPSFYEGFGFPPLEALRVGTPVVTSYNSSLPEVVGKWATLVDPYDVGELASVLRELLKKTQRVSEHIQQAIADQYSWDISAQRTIKTIEQVL